MEFAPVFGHKLHKRLLYLFYRHAGAASSSYVPLQSSNKKNAWFIIFKMFHARLTKFVVRLLFLTFLILSFHWMGSVVGRPVTLSNEMSPSIAFNGGAEDESGFGFLTLLFRDLKNDGILKGDVKSLIFAGREDQSAIFEIVNGAHQLEMVSSLDVEKQICLTEEAFNVAFINLESVEDFVARSLKTGGFVAIRVIDEYMKSFQRPNGYEVVYLRKFNSKAFIIAKKKTSEDDSLTHGQSSPTQRRLFGFATEARKAALKKLEDVLLEPPRASSGKSRTYHKRTK